MDAAAAPDSAMLRCAEQLLLACAHGQEGLALDALARLRALAAGPACTIVQLEDESEERGHQQTEDQADGGMLACAVNIVDAHGATPLMHAARMHARMPAVMELLVAAGASAGTGRLAESGNTALHLSATHGDALATKALVGGAW